MVIGQGEAVAWDILLRRQVGNWSQIQRLSVGQPTTDIEPCLRSRKVFRSIRRGYTGDTQVEDEVKEVHVYQKLR